MNSRDPFPRYYVQGETVRGEPRVYWVVDRAGHKRVSDVTRDHRQATRWKLAKEREEFCNASRSN